jgi:guanosine-3',5'-bis(diphosphate) 3'-pyrophosphohydrolase
MSRLPKVKQIWESQMSNLSLIIDALDFAAHTHRDQRRKGADATPYIARPIALARILSVEGSVEDPVVIAAALLHDTVEDCGVLPTHLAYRFGQPVADVVMELTDDKSLPKERRKELQVEHAASISDRAKLVKLADKIANVRDVGQNPPADWSEDRRHEYANWAARVVAGLRGMHPVLEAAFDDAHAFVVGAAPEIQLAATKWLEGREGVFETRNAFYAAMGVMPSMKPEYFLVDRAPEHLQTEIRRQMKAAGEEDAC